VKPNANNDITHSPLDIARPVADSMDQAIGEATTVMGAMVTELMRRSLRGGVMKIGEQLEDYVGERVDLTIAERQPALEQAAVAVAEQAAFTTAAKVAAEEVFALEQRTTEATRELKDQIDDKGQQLATRIEEGDQHAIQVTRETARELTGQIQETEKRVSETTQAQIGQQVQALTEKAREGAKILRSRLKAVVSAVADLRRQLVGEREAHLAEHAALRADIARQVEDLRRDNEALRARVAELERPRGLRRLWAWMFGGRKK
jgi:hypothetical protein